MTTLDTIAGIASLTALLRAFFRGQRDSALSAILRNQFFDLKPWVVPMSESAREPLKQAAKQGIRELLRSRLVPPVRPPQPVTAVAPVPRPLIESMFKMELPTVDEYIRTMSINFAESTNKTSEHHTEVAREMFRKELRTSLDRGEAVSDLTKRVNRIYRNPERAHMIAETECRRALCGGQWLEAKSWGGTVVKLWMDTELACPICKGFAAQGEIPIDKPFAAGGGPYGVIQHPPAHPMCLLPETTVWPPSGVSGLEARYDGPVVRIDFASGRNVTVTPNHMLLTPEGFLPAAAFVDGDDVLRHEFGQRTPFAHPDDDWQPVTIQEVFHSWTKAVGVSVNSVPTAPEYFHGDAAFCDGKVAIVTANGFLRYDGNSKTSEHMREYEFGRSNITGVSLYARSNLATVLFRLLDATGGIVGRSRELAALRFAHLRVTQEHRFRTGAGVDLLLQEPPVDSGPGQTKPFGKCKLTLPADVKTDKVVRVERLHYHGPVYDIETPSTMYSICNGIISSNCRCTATYQFATD